MRERLVLRHRRFLDALGIRSRPWLILGSAPDPTLPRELLATHCRIDINNAGATARRKGLGQADLTLRARRKAWDQHRDLDTGGLIWVHEYPALLLRALLLLKPHVHVGRLVALSRADREAIVAETAGIDVGSVGQWGKVTNGIAAACYGLWQGVPEIVLAGLSLSQSGHSMNDLNLPRRQVEEDAFVLRHLSRLPNLFTTEADFARESGVRLHGTVQAPPGSAGGC